MKKRLNRTIIVFIILSLTIAGQALAQDFIEEESQDTLATQANKTDVAQNSTDIAAKVKEQSAKIAQEQVKTSTELLNNARKELLDARKQVSKHKDALVDLRLPKVTLPYLQQNSSGGILIVPSGQVKVDNLAEITEDLSIMSHLFSKKLSQSNMLTARGRLLVELNPYFGRGNRKTEAIFLEGYGALFLLKVNMLLSAPPDTSQKKEIQEDTDPVWTQMRRQLYEPEKVHRSRTDDRPEEKFDAERVENLKTNLIKTLKHATNIRALKSDQLVILTVIGNGSQSASNVTQKYYSYGRSTGSRYVVQTTPEVETGHLLPTVLTISVKKLDIDAFAKGELDYEQFRKRIGIYKSYAKAGQQALPGTGKYKVAIGTSSAF
jgi:hypothetical protein